MHRESRFAPVPGRIYGLNRFWSFSLLWLYSLLLIFMLPFWVLLFFWASSWCLLLPVMSSSACTSQRSLTASSSRKDYTFPLSTACFFNLGAKEDITCIFSRMFFMVVSELCVNVMAVWHSSLRLCGSVDGMVIISVLFVFLCEAAFVTSWSTTLTNVRDCRLTFSRSVANV